MTQSHQRTQLISLRVGMALGHCPQLRQGGWACVPPYLPITGSRMPSEGSMTLDEAALFIWGRFMERESTESCQSPVLLSGEY